MTDNLFKKAIAFTDIHFGNKSNSSLFNDDCLEFVEWVIEQGKEQGCDTCLFLGDWHHHRAAINVATLNYSIKAIDALSKAFEKIVFIPGNHDEYYRDKRDFNSIAWIKNYSNIKIYNEVEVDGNVAIVPWLVGDEHKSISKIKAKYMFGHLELPHFYMNAMVQMPDIGELKDKDFGGVEHAFSGHFHKRQTRGNITYIGNAFPHNYSDAWDDERGVMILEWDKQPEYITWPDAPKYKTLKLGQLLDNPDKYLLPKTYARVMLDIEISYEEANFIRENFMEKYPIRELSLIQQKLEDTQVDETVEINFESVDSIVYSQLEAVETDFYDKNLLTDIYRNL
jgi:DNA repair exonuclease SbcCD nuclease subunit